MPKEPEILPGQTFHLPAAQQKNFDNLLNVLSKKEATEALTALAKTPPSAWSDVNASIGKLNKFIELGGTAKIIEGFKETVNLQIADALSPLTNEINQLLTDFFAPIDEKISEIFNDLSQFVAENPKGALVGAIGGQILGMFLPGGPALIAMGALIGASFEDWIERLLAAETPGELFDVAIPVTTPGLTGTALGFGMDLGVAIARWWQSLWGF